jgi:hypothetical protein
MRRTWILTAGRRGREWRPVTEDHCAQSRTRDAGSGRIVADGCSPSARVMCSQFSLPQRATHEFERPSKARCALGSGFRLSGGQTQAQDDDTLAMHRVRCRGFRRDKHPVERPIPRRTRLFVCHARRNCGGCDFRHCPRGSCLFGDSALCGSKGGINAVVPAGPVAPQKSDKRYPTLNVWDSRDQSGLCRTTIADVDRVNRVITLKEHKTVE